tara:strand:- start:741 stop:1484 length:744 start_codon:yes stop_codon:yes gene_type:complete
MADDVVLVEKTSVEDGTGFAEIVLNRPERRNALIPEVAEAVINALEDIEQDDGISVVIVRGQGGYFCSGIDLKALQSGASIGTARKDAIRHMHLVFYHYRKPVIAAFEGFGINAGCALALACDLVVAGESAFIQIGEIQQGATMPMNAAWMRLKLPEFVLARMALLGDRISGQEMYRLGVATECVPDDEVLSCCREMATRIAGFPLGGAVNIKQSIVGQRQLPDVEKWFTSPSSNALKTVKMLKPDS